MDHPEFVYLWRQGKLEVDVERSKALQIAGSKMLPARYRAANIFWSWVWLLTIPLSFVVMYFYKWWVGLLILVFLTPGISAATKTSAMQFIINYCIENPAFYKFALSNGIIRVRKKVY